MRLLLSAVVAIAVSSMARFADADDKPISAGHMMDRYENGSKSEKQTIVLTFFSYTNALGWANVYLEQRGDRPIFCPPTKLAIAGEQVVEIERRFLEEHPDNAAFPYDGVLLFALREAFPCN
jgi:hypothetical protein